MNQAKKKLFALLMSIVMTLVIGIGPGGMTAAALDATVNLSSLTADYTITESGSYTFSGVMATGNHIVVNPNISGGVNITLSGVKIGDPIDQMKSKYVSALEICTGTTVNLMVTGQNYMIGGNAPGILVPAGAALNIGGDGSLTASCVAVDKSAAGIGGAENGTCGTITINGGALIKAIGYKGSAGIGSGYQGSGGSITINGGNVSASAGAVGGGAAIGSGVAAGSCSVTINGGSIQASSANYGAAIGNGYGSSAAAVTITGGSVIAESGGSGSAIGNGQGDKTNQPTSTVLIRGGTVTATGSATSAGIGGGAIGNGSNLTISGGTVTASGYSGIGHGENGTSAGTCIVTGGSVQVISTISAAQAAVHYDAASTPAYPVSVTVPGITAATAVSYTVSGGSAVSCTTDAAGKLYLWLPAQTNVAVSATAGGKTYAFTGEVTSTGTNTLAAVITVGTGGNYEILADAIAAATDGSTIRLLNDLKQSTGYMVTTSKTITIDGNGNALTGASTQNTYPIPLSLSGTGTVILKNLYLFGDSSTLDNEALFVSGNVNVRSDHVYVESGSAQTSYGLVNSGSGTVDVTRAISKDGSSNYGVMNTGSGTVNVLSAEGSGPSGTGVKNAGTGTINVWSAIGSIEGVRNESTGTVNVNSAECTSGNGVNNSGGGTVNVTQAYCGSGNAIRNSGGGTVNAGTVTGTTQGTINAGSAAAALTLNKGSGASCILNSITVAAAGSTAVGSLPSVYKNGGYSNLWYTDAAKLTPASSTVTAGTKLYSSFYTPVKINTAAISGVTVPVTGQTPVSSIADTSEYTASISWLPNDAVFVANTAYTATINITAKDGYTVTGVGANFFTVSGATATNAAGSGVVTAVFPTTIQTISSLAADINAVSGLTAAMNGTTVTVTGTATVASPSDAALVIDIPAGVKVLWKASLSGGGSKYLLELTGDGTFEVAGGANIVNNVCQGAIYCSGGNGNLNVTGGKVSTTTGNGMAIGIAGGWLLTMTGGEASANAAGSCAIFGKNAVVITGGTVSATDASGYQLYMGDTSVYSGGVLDSGKIMYHPGGVFADVNIGAAVTLAPLGTSTGLTATGHNLSAGDSVAAIWAIQNGVSGVKISYYSAKVAVDEWFLAVPGTTVVSAAPAVTSISPSSGPEAGGTSVTVTGTGFTGVTGVKFGSSNAAYTVSSPTQIIAVAPAGTGTVHVAVITASGTSAASGADQFTYDNNASAAPAVTSISPSSGPEAGGTSVTVTGTGFTSVTGVKFGSSNAAYTVSSPTQIIAVAPAGTGTVHVAVTTANGTSATSGADQFSYTSTGGGGGGGSGGSSTTNPTTTVSGSTAITIVTPTVSGGAAMGAVTTDQMSDALDKAKAAAGTNGKPDVKIQIDGASGASSVGTTIPRSSMQALVSGGADRLTISGPTGSVSFGADALKTISGSASGDVTVTVAKTDSSALSDAEKTRVGNHPVFTFSVTSGGSTISQFGGSVTVSVPYIPAAGEDLNAIVIYYIAADGTLTMVPDARYDAATGTVIFTTTHFSTYAVGYNKVSFTDVSDTAWYSKAVTFLAARGITTGTTAATFSPDATLTRGQFIVMLLRAYGISADANPADNFSDAGSTYYTGYLAAAKRLAISTGIGNNMFAPEKAITRQEVFTLLYNALKALGKLPESTSAKNLSDFTDSGSVASWAREAMTALVKAGTVSGSGAKIAPTGTSTRAEMAQVLYNLLGK